LRLLFPMRWRLLLPELMQRSLSGNCCHAALLQRL
jgi:hypothetical protein